MTIADLMIVNFLYVMCCIPIFTIGAAQAGLFTAIRVLLDPEDDSSVAKAFFRGFASGFGKITVVTLILGVLMAVVAFAIVYALAIVYAGGSKAALIACIVILCVIYIVQSVSGPFHATFGCTIKQLLLNSLFFVVAYPIRSLLCAALILVPVVVFMVWPNFFMASIIALLVLYYSVAYLTIFSLFKKPFNRLKSSFYAAHSQADEELVLAEESAATKETEE